MGNDYSLGFKNIILSLLICTFSGFISYIFWLCDIRFISVVFITIFAIGLILLILSIILIIMMLLSDLCEYIEDRKSGV